MIIRKAGGQGPGVGGQGIFHLPSPIFLLVLASISAADPTSDAEVLCADGSRIKGSLRGIGGDRIEFSSPNLFKPAPLRLDQVVEIHLPGRHEDPEGDHIASITLSNGDQLKGALTHVDEEKIGLHTWYAGDLLFRRSMVDSLEIQDRPQRVYSGPRNLDEWTLSTPGCWTFESGALRSHAPGSAAREFDLPVRTRFAFDFAWRSNPRFRFLFFTDDTESSQPDNCYVLFCQNRYVHLRKHWRRGGDDGSINIGNAANVPEFVNKEKARLELLVDRRSGAIRFIVNGRVAADWTDPDPPGGAVGGGVHFVSEDSSPFRVSRIEITSWDGQIEPVAPTDEEDILWENDGESPPVEDPAALTRIRLRNNDLVAGRMLGIEDGLVTLETTFGEVRLPVSRLRTFSLHTKEEREDYMLGRYEIPRLYQGDIRAWFADGSRVTFRLENSAGGKLTGYAQPFGEASFDSSAFSRIEFNLYPSERFEHLRTSGSW